jgi:hypothetical protein
MTPQRFEDLEPARTKVVAQMLLLYRRGKTFAEITRWLNASHFKPWGSSTVWSPQYVQKIIHRNKHFADDLISLLARRRSPGEEPPRVFDPFTNEPLRLSRSGPHKLYWRSTRLSIRDGDLRKAIEQLFGVSQKGYPVFIEQVAVFDTATVPDLQGQLLQIAKVLKCNSPKERSVLQNYWSPLLQTWNGFHARIGNADDNLLRAVLALDQSKISVETATPTVLTAENEIEQLFIRLGRNRPSWKSIKDGWLPPVQSSDREVGTVRGRSPALKSVQAKLGSMIERNGCEVNARWEQLRLLSLRLSNLLNGRSVAHLGRGRTIWIELIVNWDRYTTTFKDSPREPWVLKIEADLKRNQDVLWQIDPNSRAWDSGKPTVAFMIPVEPRLRRKAGERKP